MSKRNLVVFDDGMPVRLKPCGCEQGEIKKEKTRVSDIYSPKEIKEMDLESDEVLSEYYMCLNCEQKLEEI